MLKKIINLLPLLVFIWVLQSCGNKSQQVTEVQLESSTNIEEEATQKNPIPSVFESALRANEKLKPGTVYTDTLSYVNFDDNGDYLLFFVEKNQDTIGLIHSEHKSDFIKGETIEMQWKIDSLRPAGDPEFLEFKEFIISAKRVKQLELDDKKVKFLWREDKYDPDLDTEINTIVLNQEYINTISEPEKAALAYVSYAIGNECEWDGKPNENRSNLICKIPWALGLRYQCSLEQLDFLKFWFRNNEEILTELKKCPTKPDGATVQTTFDTIELEISNNVITIFFKASRMNLRAQEKWQWTEKHLFEFKKNELLLLKKEVSEKEKSAIEMSEN